MRPGSPLSVLIWALLSSSNALVAQPSNDDFAQRAILSGFSNAVQVSNVGATVEPEEPILSPGSLSGKSLWWSWTAPFSGRASVTTAGTLFSNVLAVYLGPGLAGLSSVGQAWSSETDLA